MTPDRDATWLQSTSIRDLLGLTVPEIGPRRLGWFFVACAETLLRSRPAEERSTAFLPTVWAALDGEAPRDEVFRMARSREQAEVEQLDRMRATTSDTRRLRHRVRHQLADQETATLAAAFLADALSGEKHGWWNTVTDYGSELAHLARVEMHRLEVAAAHITHLRDIAGNPFRPVAFDPAWRTEAAVSLARGMYEARDFTPMPVLADALEDAGCTESDVLAHCRGPGPHVRGCWVVDLVLGKS